MSSQLSLRCVNTSMIRRFQNITTSCINCVSHHTRLGFAKGERWQQSSSIYSDPQCRSAATTGWFTWRIAATGTQCFLIGHKRGQMRPLLQGQAAVPAPSGVTPPYVYEQRESVLTRGRMRWYQCMLLVLCRFGALLYL